MYDFLIQNDNWKVIVPMIVTIVMGTAGLLSAWYFSRSKVLFGIAGNNLTIQARRGTFKPESIKLITDDYDKDLDLKEHGRSNWLTNLDQVYEHPLKDESYKIKDIIIRTKGGRTWSLKPITKIMLWNFNRKWK